MNEYTYELWYCNPDFSKEYKFEEMHIYLGDALGAYNASQKLIQSKLKPGNWRVRNLVKL